MQFVGYYGYDDGFCDMPVRPRVSPLQAAFDCVFDNAINLTAASTAV